jgi:hypothetical protein
MGLWADFLTNEGRSIYKWTNYFPVYEAHFARFVNRPIVFWEIGCGDGGSLRMWKRHFGPLAQIVGLDISERCKAYAEDHVAVRIGNQSDADFLDRVLAEFGPPDIVLDDGSHLMSDIVATFQHVYPKIDRNGVYMVEDAFTAYDDRYGGGLRREGTFIELSKHLIDELYGTHTGNYTNFTHSTLSMHFYDGIVVFERGRHLRAEAVKCPDVDPPINQIVAG